MKTRSYRIADALYLVVQPVCEAPPAKPAEKPVHHIAVIDCSGSMYGELPRIREQFKLKLPKLLSEKDTVSVIWFSGKGQHGVLLEGERVASLTDLSTVNKAIDRWLTPQGLTGFKEPIEEVPALAARLAKKAPDSAVSLFFMSDGCDNQWPRQDILKAVEKAAGAVSSSTFVEYGYYADRPLLAAMAQKAGGTLIFADAFDKWVPVFETAMQKKSSGAPRVEVKVSGDPVGGFAFAAEGGDLYAFEASGGKAAVPKDTASISYLSPTSVGERGRDLDAVAADDASPGKDSSDLDAVSSAYAAISLFSVRMKPDVVYPLLKAVGDVRFIDQFSGCFGKQKYSEFMDAAKAASFDRTGRWVSGRDPNRVPRDDAFTVLDMLRILSSDEGNNLLLEDPAFSYSRIGRGRVDAGSVLTDEERAEVDQLTAEMAKLKDAKKVSELASRIAAISNKPEALKFEADPAPDGYPISRLTYNEDRPNISVLIDKPGTVDLSLRLTPELRGKVPEKFPTKVYRNYAVVKDGLVNVKVLPVKLSAATAKKITDLVKDGTIPADAVKVDGSKALVYLDTLPVINRKMVKGVSAKEFFGRQFELTKAQAAQKVYNAYSKELLPSKRAEGIASQYGEEAAAWLKDLGVTDGGFNPKSVQAPSTDFYMGKELKASLKGLSKLPSLKELREQVSKGKVTPGGQLMRAAYDDVEAFLSSPSYVKAANKDGVLEAWLEGQTKQAKSEVRKLIFDIAQTTFSLVVGQVWFSEFKSLDENTMTIDADGQKLEAKAELREVEVKI